MRLTAYTAYMRAKADLEKKREAYEEECRQAVLTGAKTMKMTLVHSEGTDNLSFGKTVLENWLVFKYRWDKTEEVRTLHTEQEVRDELSRLQLDGWTMEGLY